MALENLDISAPDFKEAVCATLEDKDFFFPKQGKQEAERLPQLRALCASCIHERECLNFALDEQIADGFWGGKTPLERAKLSALPKGLKMGTLMRRIYGMQKAGRSVREIASFLKISVFYVNRAIETYDAANNKGAVQLQKQTKNLSKGSYL